MSIVPLSLTKKSPNIHVPPLTSEQRSVKRRIERDIENLEAEVYDNFVLSRMRKEFGEACCILLQTLLIEHGSKKKYKTLEVASGTGIITECLMSLNLLEVFCLEMNQKFIDFAVEKGRVDKTDVCKGDFHDLPKEFEDSFDVYTGVAFLNHRSDIDTFYNEIYKVLHVGGYVFFPWRKPRESSIQREVENLQQKGFEIVEKGDWYLFGRKNT